MPLILIIVKSAVSTRELKYKAALKLVLIENCCSQHFNMENHNDNTSNEDQAETPPILFFINSFDEMVIRNYFFAVQPLNVSIEYRLDKRYPAITRVYYNEINIMYHLNNNQEFVHMVVAFFIGMLMYSFWFHVIRMYRNL